MQVCVAKTGNYLTRLNETSALCTNEYSDIIPVTGGNVIFTTLEHRPSQENLENSPTLQEFITASHIRIVLDRMNVFGDHLFGHRQALQSYYYAIHDLAVGGLYVDCAVCDVLTINFCAAANVTDTRRHVCR